MVANTCMQEVFGLSASPSVAGGRVRVALELLAPNSNTLQVTSDLAAFWAGSYAQVRLFPNVDDGGHYPLMQLLAYVVL